MKKILALLLVLAMALSLAACGGGEEAAAGEGEYKIAMVTDYADITDQSFNQSTWEAVTKFGEDNGIEYKYYKPTTNDTAGRVASVELAVVDGYNIIVMPGYAFGGTIAEISDDYPDVKFIALDVGEGDLMEAAVGATYWEDPSAYPLNEHVHMENVYSAIYQEELCGYMAG